MQLPLALAVRIKPLVSHRSANFLVGSSTVWVCHEVDGVLGIAPALGIRTWQLMGTSPGQCQHCYTHMTDVAQLLPRGVCCGRCMLCCALPGSCRCNSGSSHGCVVAAAAVVISSRVEPRTRVCPMQRAARLPSCEAAGLLVSRDCEHTGLVKARL